MQPKNPKPCCAELSSSSSDEGDIVADLFCGSGTTMAAAEKLNRKWIGCDLGRFGVYTSYKRMIDLQRQLHSDGKTYRCFDLYNLGRYERQWWQKERLRGADAEHRKIVLQFYKAEDLSSSGSTLIHGKKGSAAVHVANIDSILTRQELVQIVKEAVDFGVKQLNCLAWEFEMELKLAAQRLEAENNLIIRLLRIPREIMERNRSDVTFFEIATLEAQVLMQKGQADVEILKFIPSLAEIAPVELDVINKRALTSGFDFIDFWAVCFDYHQNQPFRHDWQAYRLRRKRYLPLRTDIGFKFEQVGAHSICVKVVDIFGCDTSITLSVDFPYVEI